MPFLLSNTVDNQHKEKDEKKETRVPDENEREIAKGEKGDDNRAGRDMVDNEVVFTFVLRDESV